MTQSSLARADDGGRGGGKEGRDGGRKCSARDLERGGRKRAREGGDSVWDRQPAADQMAVAAAANGTGHGVSSCVSIFECGNRVQGARVWCVLRDAQDSQGARRP